MDQLWGLTQTHEKRQRYCSSYHQGWDRYVWSGCCSLIECQDDSWKGSSRVWQSHYPTRQSCQIGLLYVRGTKILTNTARKEIGGSTNSSNWKKYNHVSQFQIKLASNIKHHQRRNRNDASLIIDSVTKPKKTLQKFPMHITRSIDLSIDKYFLQQQSPPLFGWHYRSKHYWFKLADICLKMLKQYPEHSLQRNITS
jgi:hypothetical protein